MFLQNTSNPWHCTKDQFPWLPQTADVMTPISVILWAACAHSYSNIAYDSTTLYDILTLLLWILTPLSTSNCILSQSVKIKNARNVTSFRTIYSDIKIGYKLMYKYKLHQDSRPQYLINETVRSWNRTHIINSKWACSPNYKKYSEWSTHFYHCCITFKILLFYKSIISFFFLM
jgi:hypothetical protein